MLPVLPIIGGILAAAGLIALVVITLKKIREWVRKNRTGIKKEKVEMRISQDLESGNFTLVTGIFTRKGFLGLKKDVSAREIFEGKSMDPELEAKFKGKNRVVIPANEV